MAFAKLAGGTMAPESVGGYLHPGYAQSLPELGRPVHLPDCGGWMLARHIPGSDLQDLMGAYPLFACRDWSRLHDDLDGLAKHYVCAHLVSDPFGNFSPRQLQAYFTDVCRPFKQHVVVDLQHAPLEGVSAHHRRYARKALREVTIEICTEPRRHLETWVSLYGNLVGRHGLRGPAAFSEESFARQLDVPGLVMMRAVQGGATIGMVLWYVHDSVAYYHLGACDERGYRARASFASFWTAFDYFRGRAEWANLGGGAGVRGTTDDGLSAFKAGWSKHTRTTYFCGRTFDRAAYRTLSAAHVGAGYYPAYRFGEFA